MLDSFDLSVSALFPSAASSSSCVSKARNPYCHFVSTCPSVSVQILRKPSCSQVFLHFPPKTLPHRWWCPCTVTVASLEGSSRQRVTIATLTTASPRFQLLPGVELTRLCDNRKPESDSYHSCYIPSSSLSFACPAFTWDLSIAVMDSQIHIFACVQHLYRDLHISIYHDNNLPLTQS